MEEQEIQERKQNMKLYSIYRAISLDLIFYYAIEVLFLTQAKNISVADIVLSQSFYAIFMIALQIPVSIIIDKIGTRDATILGNFFNFIYVILIIFCNGLGRLIFARFISAICFSMKNISDTTLIHYSIPETKKEGEIFSKLEGKGFKNYYILDAITSIIAGFLYVINPYIPMIGSLIFTLLSIMLSFKFYDLEPKYETKDTKKYFLDLASGVKFITKSQRLRSLFLYSGIAWGVFCLVTTYRTSLLIDIGTSEQFITVVAAICAVASSIGSKIQLQFHNHFRNKSLSTILYILTGSIWIAGIVAVFNINYEIVLFTIVICFILMHIAKGIHGVLITRYLGNFADDKILTQIYAVNEISRNIFRAIIGFIGAYLLNLTNTSHSMILVGIILFITVLGLTSYMKTRVGLKPEEYDKNEIYNL